LDREFFVYFGPWFFLPFFPSLSTKRGQLAGVARNLVISLICVAQKSCGDAESRRGAGIAGGVLVHDPKMLRLRSQLKGS
jgi:hypothetical protein